MPFESRHISVSISCPAAEVYEFAYNPENLPKWASGLAGSITKVNESWVVESPMGKVRVRFADLNSLGILDHNVVLPSGETVSNPMRVIPNGTGSEVVFTLHRRPGMTGQAFADDANTVLRDLHMLKLLLEKNGEKMIRAKCDECGGKLTVKDVDFSLFGTNLGRFPAEVCTKCGEKVFSEEVSDRIDSVAKEKGLWGLGVKTTVGQVGGSLDIRINRRIAEFTGLKKGQAVLVHPDGKNRIVITT